MKFLTMGIGRCSTVILIISALFKVITAKSLIEEEPLKPWITLKRNIRTSYSSSIGSWFMKRYPKQNKTFQVYAIEADKVFHNQYE
ncbi:Methyltransferase FkbM [Gossypium australe]|uniref:Methyltransferase FkbM n=1 Tax=Gossypium australe TaxID=47621 RepID=A0A5B6X6W3_9ROSI|nr:Methyltransferase FkbM [Gossypium australe]